MLLYAWTILRRFIAHSDTFLPDPSNEMAGMETKGEGEQGRAKGKIASWAKKDEEEEEEESSEEGGDRRSPLDRHSANFSRIPNVR